jgi:hypothetical protein
VLETYTPYSLLTRPNPIFERERATLRLSPAEERLPHFSFTGLYLIGLVGVAALIGVPWLLRNPRLESLGAWLPLLCAVYLVLQWLVSLGADGYVIVQSINQWQLRQQREHWDVVRLTPVGESAVVHAFRALIELRVWRTVQIETTMRLVLPGLPILAVVLGSWVLPILLALVLVVAFDIGEGLGTVALLVALGYFLGQLGIAYLREPVWRMRTVTALSMWAAARFAEPPLALLSAVCGTLLLRLVPALLLAAVYQIALLLLALPIGDLWAGMAAAAWIGAVGVALTPGARLLHGRLTDVFTQRVIDLLRRGE